MNLLIITQDFPPNVGGIESYSIALAKCFHRMAKKVAVIAPAHPNSDKIDNRLPFTVHRLNIKNSLLVIKASLILPRILKEGEYDVVFNTQWQTLPASIIARKRGFPIRIFVAAHGRELLLEPFAGSGGFLSRTLVRYRNHLLKQCDGFFPVSQFTANLLLKSGVEDEKISVVSNGTDPKFFSLRSNNLLKTKHGLADELVILTIARLVPHKGIDLVLRALPAVLQFFPNLIYLIGGKGEYKNELQILTRQLNLEDHVRFLDYIPMNELPDYYNLCDLFVMPSRFSKPNVEGFGIVFLEANACGKPVIGSRTGGIPEAIIEGETGLLVNEDDVEGLANAIIRILSDEKLADYFKQNGRERVVNEANWNNTANRIMAQMDAAYRFDNHPLQVLK